MGADWSEESEREYLEWLKEYKAEELKIIAEAEAQRHQLEKQYSELTRRLKEQNLMAELKAYQSSAASVAKLVGAGIKEQALIMIPFELAEATKEMADFLATKDPSHLAASLKHALAVKQYAEAAKTSAPSSSGGSSGGASPATRAQAEPTRPEHRARVVVNVGDGIVLNAKEFTRQLVEGLNEAYRDNVRIEFA